MSQRKVEKQMEEIIGSEISASSIVQKTARISEENVLLLEKVSLLSDNINLLTKENEALKKESEENKIKIKNSNDLIEIFYAVQNGDTKKAATLFENLSPEHFSENEERFYKYLQKRIRNLY